MVTIHALLASIRGGLDQSTTTRNLTEFSWVDNGCLNSGWGVIFPDSHRAGHVWASLWKPGFCLGRGLSPTIARDLDGSYLRIC